MRIRTWLSRTCLTGAAALMVLAFVAPPSATAADERPASFRATGFATPIQVGLNTDPQTFVEQLIRFDLPHGSSTFASGDEASGRASGLFPGAATEEGPGLAWGLFWGSFCAPGNFPCQEFPGLPPANPIPPWPLSAQAEYPTRPEAQPTVTGQQVGEPGGPISFTLHGVKATATADGVTTTAAISNLDLLPVAGAATAGVPGTATAAANPSVIHVAGLHATTKLRFQGRVLVAEAESRLSGVSLFGGAVEIDTILARSVSRADAGTVLENDPVVTVGGVTVGGQPAVITDKGIAVAKGTCVAEVPQLGQVCATDQGAIPILSNGIGTIFGEGPLQVRLVSSTDDRRAGTAGGDAVGLLVTFEVDASGFPSGVGILGNLVLGTASTSAFASNFSDEADVQLDEGFDFEEDSGFEAFADGGDGFDGSGTFVGGETVEAGDEDVQAAPQVVGQGRRLQPRYRALEALLSGVAADRIQLLYGAWTLGLIGLALGSRLHWVRLATHR